MLDNRFLHTQHGFSGPMKVLRILQSKSNNHNLQNAFWRIEE